MSNLEPVLPRRETWSSRRLHANFDQKQEKKSCQRKLRKNSETCYVNLKNTSMLITESNNGMHLLNKLQWTT